MSQVGGASRHFDQSKMSTVDLPPVVDAVTIEILLTAMLELFKFQESKQRRLHHRNCIK